MDLRYYSENPGGGRSPFGIPMASLRGSTLGEVRCVATRRLIWHIDAIKRPTDLDEYEMGSYDVNYAHSPDARN